MTALSRRQALGESLNQQIAGFRTRGMALSGSAELLVEHIDRALGFARLDGVTEDALASSDLLTLVALAARAVLAEMEREASPFGDAKAPFRATLLNAMLWPDAGRLEALLASAKAVALATKLPRPPETVR